MRVYLKTNISPEVKVYDSDATGQGFFSKVFSPVVIVRDDSGKTLFTYGEYRASAVGAFLVLGLAFVGIMLIMRR